MAIETNVTSQLPPAMLTPPMQSISTAIDVEEEIFSLKKSNGKRDIDHEDDDVVLSESSLDAFEDAEDAEDASFSLANADATLQNSDAGTNNVCY
jgi:hypothetical protein